VGGENDWAGGEIALAWRFMGGMHPKGANGGPDRLIAQVAARQHAVIAIDELLAAGLSHEGVKTRVRAGRLHRKHRGVYAIGNPRLDQHGIWLAAVKACGDQAALSHQSAAQLAKLLPLPAYRGPVHVTVAGAAGRRQRKGIVIHRSRTLTGADVQIRDVIPVTKPERTLIDLRRVLDRDEWEDALDRARVLALPIGDLAPTEPTRSRFERRMLALCHRHRLLKPEVNARVGPFLVDFFWREARLIVEADSFEHHRDRAAFEADRARDAQLALMGYRVVRFTWRRVRDDPAGVATTIRGLLGAPWY
jgi:very-short-patch-repair endonuclease